MSTDCVNTNTNKEGTPPETEHKSCGETQRENLAGGSGAFANFFEEMAELNSSSFATRQVHSGVGSPVVSKEHSLLTGSAPGDSYEGVQAFLRNFSENDDLDVLNQYKMFKNHERSPEEAYIEETPVWLQERNADDFWLTHQHTRAKPLKILADRFLLGETIGRGSYGKVKDAIDLVNLRRHAIKIISRHGIRKIPGGWNQALLEAAVMRQLRPNPFVVSLTRVLFRLEDDPPDRRLCLVLEHCLGSVHDLQATGVPFNLDDDDEDDEDNYGPDVESNLYFADPRSKSTIIPPPGHHRYGAHHDDDDNEEEDCDSNRVISGRKASNIESTRDPTSLNKRKDPHQLEHQQSQQQQQQFRRLPEAQAHAYFLQVINGLHFLHSNGVIHRDIKPGNLLLTPAPGIGLTDDALAYDPDSGEDLLIDRSLGQLLYLSRGWLVKLADFGVSASLPTFQPTELVGGGQITPAVQPPEVAKGVDSAFVGSKLDIYSAGVSLYFMLTGRVPFACFNVLQIFEAIAKGEYTIPGHVTTHATDLIRKMMAKNPVKRLTLAQVAHHPWIVSDPPQPLDMAACRERLARTQQTSSSSTGNTTTAASPGQLTWLDPLVYLRRPPPIFPSPHIDANGARIFSSEECYSLGGGGGSADDDEDDHRIRTIAPISVVEQLEVYHEMADQSLRQAHFEIPNPSLHEHDLSASGNGLVFPMSHLGISDFPEHSSYLPPPHPHNHGTRDSPCNTECWTTSPPDDYPYYSHATPEPLVQRRSITIGDCEPPICPSTLPVLSHYRADSLPTQKMQQPPSEDPVTFDLSSHSPRPSRKSRLTSWWSASISSIRDRLTGPRALQTGCREPLSRANTSSSFFSRLRRGRQERSTTNCSDFHTEDTGDIVQASTSDTGLYRSRISDAPPDLAGPRQNDSSRRNRRSILCGFNALRRPSQRAD